ncbi:hypothetical protein RIF29_14415 [Crotalaria pallida]|uniref:Uncharacterized protein n=1 Tax=Crotalaria pallida TaxID=3830 RepID=A0AAN9FDT7_CROPI
MSRCFTCPSNKMSNPLEVSNMWDCSTLTPSLSLLFSFLNREPSRSNADFSLLHSHSQISLLLQLLY